jgi:hypothetical protein
MDDNDQISVLAEFERLNTPVSWASDQEVKIVCPFHNDHGPSLFVNVEKRVFKCQSAACGKDGDFIGLLAKLENKPRADVVSDLSTRYTLSNEKIVEADAVERWHEDVWNAGPLLQELYKRGVTDELVRKYRLGHEKGRITIPVKNISGMYVNVRKYLPGAPGPQKMKNMRNRSKPRLFPIEQMKYDEIVLCGGEMKAIVAAEQLNRHGIGAVCVTAGEGNWHPDLTPLFRGKKVWVMLDVDAAGKKSAEEHCTRLRPVVRWIGNSLLPLDTDKHPKGDINDFVMEGGSLKRVLNETQEWVPARIEYVTETEPDKVLLAAAAHARFAGKRIEVEAVATMVDTAPYVVPKTTRVLCDRSQDYCTMCPVYSEDKSALFHIPSESPSIMKMVATSHEAQKFALMQGIGIPTKCPVAEFEPVEFYNVEDVRLAPQLDIANGSGERVMQPALCIGERIDLNEPYKMIGRMHPHPKTQMSTLLISKYEHSNDALSNYVCEEPEKLLAFRPLEWTVAGIQASLDRLYEDLEANVTRIYQRRDLHLTVDLAYHSPLWFNFDGRGVKGWVETIIVGDTGQGKSDTVAFLKDHYGLGHSFDCKNASVAGILGGVQSSGGRYFTTWGVMPTHDRRLVIWEELKGAAVEVIGKMTDMRSRGVAEITKIDRRRTYARTRLIAISNARGDCKMSSFPFGVQAIQELVGGLEDVRRFDMGLIISAADIDPRVLNRLREERVHVDHVFTQDLCRNLVLWTWTRTPEQVHFEQDAVKMCLSEATRLSGMFTDAIPLIDSGSSRYKLARLAASLAARTFSASEDMSTIIVRACHVKFVADMLVRIYSSSSFGYLDLSAAVQLTENLLNPDQVKRRVASTPFPEDFLNHMLHTALVEVTDVMDWTAWQRQDATELMSFLVRKHALMRDGRSAYRKTPKFISLLREMLETKSFVARPDYVEEPRKEEY